jgi:hypothetical protein
LGICRLATLDEVALIVEFPDGAADAEAIELVDPDDPGGAVAPL